MNKNNKINVEVRLKKPANNKEELIAEIKKAMSEIDEYNITNGKNHWQPPLREYLCEKVDRIICYFTGKQNEKPIQCKPEDWESANYFLYTTTNYGPMAEEINTGNDGGGGDDAAIGSYQWELPTIEFEDLWQSLVYDNKCPKEEMLKFIKTTMKMVNANVNPAIITQNRLILLKGPPGTGKTTLCKAVAQKIAIRMPFSKYKKVHFVEVNSHSLFSKWFSESGKLIQKLFTRIQELAEREDWLIFVLIDEIESLTMGREASISGNDPTDSVRAVNAILTQLDKTKRFKNVFILCTSNIEKALDTAFIDRVGLIRHIGHPGEEAIFTILMESIRELINTGLMRGSADEGEIMQNKCRQIAKNIGGRMSGRTLRNLPLEIFSECDDGLDYLHSPTVELAKYLDCIEQKTKTFQNDGPSLDKAMSNLSILH